MSKQQANGSQIPDPTPRTLTRALYLAFSKVIAAAQSSQLNQGSGPVRDAWVLALGAPDDRALWSTFNTLHDAIDRLEAAVPRLPNAESKKLMAELVAAMRAWMDLKSLSSSCTSFVQRTNLQFLHFAEQAIESATPEADLSAAALAVVMEKLTELQAASTDKDIPDQLRAMLHALVARVSWAVANYGIVGAQGLVRSVTEAQLALAEIARLSGDIGPTEQPGWFATSWSALREISKRATEAVAIVKGGQAAIELGEKAFQLLSKP